MPVEVGRTTARKRIPIGTSFVDVPVITKISFIDPADRYQEWQYTIDNSGKSDRVVHVDTITGTNVSLAVERIDRWTTLDPADRGQETQMTMDNVTGADSSPPHFSTHVQTHVVRYKNPDDTNVWIASELIDSFTVIDPSDRYQEIRFTLTNPENDDGAQADPNDPEISDPTNAIDPPWRTDPFQNIVDVQFPPATGGHWWILKMRSASGNNTQGDSGDYTRWSLLGEITDETYSVLFPVLDGTLGDLVNYYDLIDCLAGRWAAKPWLHDLIPALVNYEEIGVTANFYTGGFSSPAGVGNSWIPYPNWSVEWNKDPLICWIGVKFDWDYPFTGYEPGQMR